MKSSKFYPWLVVALLWGVALLNYMDRQMLTTMKDSMAIDIAELQTAENFGRLMAIFLWIYGLMSPVAGVIADKINRKWLIVGSLFVWSGVTLLMGYATDYEQLFWLRAAMGVSEALYIPAGLSLIADYHTGGARSLAVGLHMTGLYMGQAIGGFGATIASTLSWQSTFHWFGLVGIIYAALLVILLRDKERGEKPSLLSHSAPQRAERVKPFYTNFAFWILLLYFTASSFPGWATKTWLPTLFAENLDKPMTIAGPMATITIALSSFVGVFIGGTLSDRWVKRNLRGRVYTSAIGLGLTIPSLLLLGFGHEVWVLMGVGLLFGIGYGIFDANNMPILCQFVSVRQRATAYGVMNMTGVFAGALITNLLGTWKDNPDFELGQGFAWLALVVAVALLLQLLSLRPKTDNMV